MYVIIMYFIIDQIQDRICCLLNTVSFFLNWCHLRYQKSVIKSFWKNKVRQLFQNWSFATFNSRFRIFWKMIFGKMVKFSKSDHSNARWKPLNFLQKLLSIITLFRCKMKWHFMFWFFFNLFKINYVFCVEIFILLKK